MAQQQAPDPGAFIQFFNLGVQYYAAARFAAKAGMLPVAGTLFHHAVEMLLKGHLSRARPLEALKDLGHDLRSLWVEFEKEFPGEGFSPFAQVVSSLDCFEELRYPDKISNERVFLRGEWNVLDEARDPSEATQLPRYEFVVTEIDTFIARIFEISSVNPRSFLSSGVVNNVGRHILLEENPQ